MNKRNLARTYIDCGIIYVFIKIVIYRYMQRYAMIHFILAF